MRGADGVIRSTPKWGDNRLGVYSWCWTVGHVREKTVSTCFVFWSDLNVCSKSRLLISYTVFVSEIVLKDAETPMLMSF